MTAEVEIQKSKVKLETSTELIGLPVKSKAFSYKCETGDSTCNFSDDEDGGCAITKIDDGNQNVFVIFAKIAFFFAFITAIRRFTVR